MNDPSSTSEYDIESLLANDEELEAMLDGVQPRREVENPPADGHWTENSSGTPAGDWIDKPPAKKAETTPVAAPVGNGGGKKMNEEVAFSVNVDTGAVVDDTPMREDSSRVEAVVSQAGSSTDITTVIGELRQENAEIKAQFSQLIQLVNKLAPLAQGGGQQQPQESAISRDIPTRDGGNGIMEYLANRGAASAPAAPPGDNGSNLPAPTTEGQQQQPAVPNMGGFFANAFGLIKLAKELGLIGSGQPAMTQQQNFATSMQPFLESFQVFSAILGEVRTMVLSEANASSTYMARIAKSMGREFLTGSVAPEQHGNSSGSGGLPAPAVVVNPTGGNKQ